MFRLLKFKDVLTHPILTLLPLLLFCPLLLAATDIQTAPDPSTAVVEIIARVTNHDDTSPWNTSWEGQSGTGFIIEGKRILTTADLVSQAAYITIRPNGTPQTFEAEVETISHESNLAILKLQDESFFEGRHPLTFTGLPKPQANVSLYGYPVGGYKIGVTQGIVSRIEYQTYYHSGLAFQTIQIDAAINAGSVGSPALVDGKVIGIVAAAAPEIANTATQNIGYLIPTSRIEQLLDDLKDKSLDGIPELWVDYQFITNPEQKKHYKLTNTQSGILVSRPCAHADTAMQLATGDVITAIDGNPITEEGLIQANGEHASDFRSYIDLHQIGDIVALDIIRDGGTVKQNIALNKPQVAEDVPEDYPRYFIFGGFVLLATHKPQTCEVIAEDETGEVSAAEDEVNIVQVLPAASNIGYHDIAPMTITSVNDSDFTTFEEFYSLVKSTTAKTIILKNDAGYQVVINRALAESEQDALLAKYRIQKSQSDEIEQGE